MTSALASIPDFFYQMFAYREYLKQSVLRDLRNRYKRSVFGYLWTMVHPLAMMAVLAVVFSNIMRIPVKDYAVFLFCGLLPWNYFQSTVMMSLGSIRTNARLFSQMDVPKYLFILSVSFSNLFNFLVALVPLILIMVVLGRPLPYTILYLPIFLLPLFCVVIGISLILAASNVFFDDVHHLTEVAMSILYFLSPVLYNRESLPEYLIKPLETFNPLFCQIEFLRGIFYSGTLPTAEAFMTNFAVSLGILLVGLLVFRSAEDKFLYFI
jgi:ABC-type polysaccharide/polyol phosphate export permease